MASKRRIRRNECGNKRRYLSHQAAQDAMHSLIRADKKGGGYLRVYRCRFCRGWHYGHAGKGHG